MNQLRAAALTIGFAVLGSGGAAVAQQTDRATEASAATVDSAEVATAAQDRTTPPAIDLDSGERSEPPESDFLQLLQRREGFAKRQNDYSLAGRFGKRHGQFMADCQRPEPNTRIWGGAQSTTGLSGEDGEFSFWELGTAMQGEVVYGSDTFLSFGGLFNMRDYDFDEDATALGDMRLYMLFLDIGFGTFLGDFLLIEGHFQPGLATDFGGTITSNQWKWFGDLVATLRTGDWLYWKIGGRVDETFADTSTYPILGLSVLMGEHLRFDLLAPRYVELAWSPNAAWSLRGGALLQGIQYGYHRTTGAAGTQNDLEARTQEYRVYLDGVWHPDAGSNLTARVGGTVGGDYDIERAAFAGRYAGEIESAFFFELSFGATF